MLSKRTVIAVLSLTMLCAGALGSQAFAGKKKKTSIEVNAGPVRSGSKSVKVGGSLNSSTSCLSARSMRLFLTDAAGNVQATIDSTTSRSGGTWKLSAKLTAEPTADQRLQVKVKKLTVGKFVCKAALSKLIVIE